MEVMNVLRKHSKPNSKQPRRRHLGSIVRSFVGITDLFGEKGVPEAMFQFNKGKEPDGGNKLQEPTKEMVSDGSAITTENDFARYAMFWLRVVSHTVSPELVDVRTQFLDKALSDKVLQ